MRPLTHDPPSARGALILLASWATIGWIGPATRRELLADHGLSRGRIWIAVLVVTLFAPSWAAWLRGIVGPT